ncbi:hypothetical protein CXP39_03265 [Mesoplasma syrphidae]|uniref:Uncharacterized protein n=1 Tax=Mesoplasma syrphidae TaxID=225999 RepID=A0A2K9C9V6_9MOLU|nr:hypothetical protein [Mesoplasma syrphidae]AUF83795.1 hypothetical protein CXP39_03265 [Mesoplasma syrphidae]
MEFMELIAAAQSCETSIIEIINSDEQSETEFKEFAIEEVQHLATLFKTFLVELDKKEESVDTLWFSASKLVYEYIEFETKYELEEDVELETIEDVKIFRFQVLEFFSSFFDESEDLDQNV